MPYQEKSPRRGWLSGETERLDGSDQPNNGKRKVVDDDGISLTEYPRVPSRDVSPISFGRHSELNAYEAEQPATPREPIIHRRPVRGPSIEEVPSYTRSLRAPSFDSYRTADEVPVARGQEIKATHYWWWWDIAGAALSIISVVAIIVLLASIHDTPLETWPLGIRPNSLISVLTTIAKTAMLVPIASCISQLKWQHIQQEPRPLGDLQVFDGASRGPWGSAVMIWKLPLQSKLACSLAVVTLLALGIDPSAQQTLDFPLKDRTLGRGSAEVGRANMYLSKAFEQAEGRHWLGLEPTLELIDFQSTILHGLAGSPANPDFNCLNTATRCEWRDVSTMGVCGSLRDVTDQTSRDCNKYNGNRTDIQNCTYSIPLGDNPWNQTEHELDLRYIDSAGWQNRLETDILRTEFIPGYATSGWVGQLVVVRHDEHTWPETGTPPEPDMVAVADFRWCKKTYELETVTAGTFSYDETSAAVELLSWADGAHMGGSDSSGYWRDIFATPDGNEGYSIARTVGSSLPKYLAHLLSTGMKTSTDGGLPESGREPKTAMHTGNMLYKADLMELTHNLARTLTSQMRKDGNGDNANATMSDGGIAIVREPFIVVQWAWLILPAVEVLLVVILLAWTIIVTATTPLLKASVVAFFLFPLRGWTEDEMHIRGVQTAEKLERMSQGMRGRMENDEGRYRIVRHDR